MYTQENCMACKVTQRYLGKLGVPYTVKDMDEESARVAEAFDIMSAPVVVVEDFEHDTMVAWGGYNPEKLKGLLDE